ncbi:MAG: hypothetical protein M1436_02780, partial [Acidobacteria bacterium]|nr:hypothetical protein [Acidobacteriota bacterium]
MKKRRRQTEQAGPGGLPCTPSRAAGGIRWWHWALALAGALIAVLEAYGPALRGPFVFDDQYLPFTDPALADQPLHNWFVGVRPLLMFSFWANFRISQLHPLSYHLFNVLFHFITAVLVFLIGRRLLGWAGTKDATREILAAFAGGLFLLHPVQTESVAYVASRSEALSVMFFYAAFALFLYRRSSAVSWPVAAGVLLLFGAAATTKEHTAVLPALLLLTDWFWAPEPGFSPIQRIRRNWRL